MRPNVLAFLLCLGLACRGGGGAGTGAGRTLLELAPLGAAAERYSTGDEDRSASPVTLSLVASVGGLAASRCLDRAAGAYARAAAAVDRVPLDGVEFLLHWAGCADQTAAVAIVEAARGRSDGWTEELRELARAESATHLGVAEHELQGGRVRRVAFLVERRFELAPIPAVARPKETVPLRFRLDHGLTRPRVILTNAGGVTEESPVVVAGDWAQARLPLSSAPGRTWVEVVAEGRLGPEVVALFPLWVGVEAPGLWRGDPVPPEPRGSGPAAEARLLELVNRERERFGVPPVAPEPRLADAARAHAAEMLRSGVFAHVSPTRGDVAARVAATGYRIRAVGENLARAPSLTEAHEALMRSPGHRATIVGPEYTEVGIAALQVDGAWVVVQEFGARLEAAPDAVLEWRVREELDRARSTLALPPLGSEATLDLTARAVAEAVAASPSSASLPSGLARDRLEASGRPFERLALVVGRAFSPADVTGIEAAAWAHAAGIGVAQAQEPGHPSVWVLLLVADR